MPQTRSAPGWAITDNYVDEELGTLKAGKEAGCFLVRRSAGDRFCLLVKKDYRKRSDRTYNSPVRAGERSIRRDVFMESVAIRLPSERKAVRANNQVGKLVMEATWAHREFATLRLLWENGARVPYPVEETEHGFYMQYIGTPSGAAPRLSDLRLDRDEAKAIFDRLIGELGIFAQLELVHGDLSAYNVLVQHGCPWVIDLPQAVGLGHSIGRELFARDVANICKHFARLGVKVDSRGLTDELLG
jgi:RIO kinase 1